MDQELRTGCMGWSYKDWVGPFYPAGAKPNEFLQLYSKIFDTVEIDSSFYSMPAAKMLERWRKGTPEGFRFTLKVPRKITHEGKLKVDAGIVDEFEEGARKLGEKLSCALILLPPSSRYEQMFDRMQNMLELVSEDLRYAVEFRHGSWFREEVYELLREKKVSFAWSTNQFVETPPEITTDLVYMRFIGHRGITKFDRIQKDRTSELTNWSGKIDSALNGSDIRQALVFSNNHFAGFAPGTINHFRRLSGLDEKEWSRALLESRGHSNGKWKQTSLESE